MVNMLSSLTKLVLTLLHLLTLATLSPNIQSFALEKASSAIHLTSIAQFVFVVKT